MNAAARTSDIFGEAAPFDSPPGTLRKRRQDRGSSTDMTSEGYTTSTRGSPHPLLPLDDEAADNLIRQRRQSSVTDVATANFDEISRPSLFRLTSDLEREVQAAHVISRSSVDETSLRGSLDQRRSSTVKEPPKEVEVIVHEIQPRESLQGIALRYGIELATLRKVNKLWPTDPLHLRRQLYVPLEECRWAKTSDAFVRGPGEGQITIFKKESRDKRAQASSDVLSNVNGESIDKGKGREMDLPAVSDPWSGSVPPPQAAPTATATNGQILSVLRIPASELSFFPKNKSKYNLTRRSIDGGALDAIRNGSPGSTRNSATVKTISTSSSLRNSFDSMPRPPNGRINSMTPIEEAGMKWSSKLGPAQPGIELLPRHRNGDARPSGRKTERKASSGWSLNFFSTADDGIDPDDIGKIKI